MAAFVLTMEAINHFCSGSGDQDAREEALRVLLVDCEADRWRDWSGLEEIVLHRLAEADLLEYGTTIRCAWRLPLGEAVLAELINPTLCRCTHRASEHVFGYQDTDTAVIGHCSRCDCAGFVGDA